MSGVKFDFTRLDPDFHVPIISEVDFLKLKPVDKQALNQSREVQSVVFKGRVIRVLDKTSVIAPEYDLALMATGKTPTGTYETVRFEGSNKTQLPESYRTLTRICERLKKEVDKAYILPVFSIDCLDYIISFFCIYDSFGPIYEAYTADPDVNVQLYSSPPAQADLQATGRSPSINDIKVTCHLLLLLMAKTFSQDAATRRVQIENYLKSRLGAVRSTLGITTGDFWIKTDGIDEMQMIWNSVPKLKVAIFHWSVQFRNIPEFGIAHILLAESQMIGVSCMVKFIESEIKSKAHGLPEIWAEVDAFLKVYQELKDRMGALWIYYRVLSPKDTTLASSKFPNLSRASVLFVKEFIDTSPSFAQVVPPKTKTVANLDTFAKTRDQSNYYAAQGRTSTFTEAQINGAKRIGIDLDQWRATPSSRKRLQLTDEMMDTFVRFKEYVDGASTSDA